MLSREEALLIDNQLSGEPGIRLSQSPRFCSADIRAGVLRWALAGRYVLFPTVSSSEDKDEAKW